MTEWIKKKEPKTEWIKKKEPKYAMFGTEWISKRKSGLVKNLRLKFKIEEELEKLVVDVRTY